MRKFISVLMIAVMVLSLSAVAFAAVEGPSVAATEAAPKVEGAVNAKGEKVEVVVGKPELEAGETIQSVADEAVDAALKSVTGLKADDIAAAEVFDVSMKDGTQPDGSVKVTIVRSTKDGGVAAVMYQAEDGSWDSAEFLENDDGTVTITFKHFCTVVLLTKAPEQAPDVKPTEKPDEETEKTDSSSKEPTSPKTGYD